MQWSAPSPPPKKNCLGSGPKVKKTLLSSNILPATTKIAKVCCDSLVLASANFCPVTSRVHVSRKNILTRLFCARRLLRPRGGGNFSTLLPSLTALVMPVDPFCRSVLSLSVSSLSWLSSAVRLTDWRLYTIAAVRRLYIRACGRGVWSWRRVN